MGVQIFDLMSSFFLMPYVGFRFLFAHFVKIAIKRKCVIDCLTNEQYIKVNSCTKFAVNLMNIKGVMSVYSCKTFVSATGKLSMGIP